MKKLFLPLIVLMFGLMGLLFYQSGSSKKLEPPFVVSTPKPDTNEVSSPDGSMKLIMTNKQNDQGVLYSFIISNQLGKTIPIFSKTAIASESMSIPHNSWSPNNKYVLIEDKIAGKIYYLVFKTNGEPFMDGQKYLDATMLFNQKVKNYDFKEITGWDDPVLVSVRTVNGPHFWFDLTTESFIQLVR